MKKRATLNDIAKILNLTKVGVSKALRNHPDISEATKIKVRKIAKEIGYRPNLIARSLTSSKTKTLGVIVPKIAHNFFSHIVGGIQKYASSKGYGIVLAVSDESERLERQHIESLVSMQVEGLLVSVSMETKKNDVFKWVRNLQIPLVFFDRHLPGMGFNSVIIDDEAASMDAVNRLIEKGYKNIAHIGGFDHVPIGRNRRLGYEKALLINKIPVDSEKIITGGFGEDAGYQGFKQLIARCEKPDAIFGVTFPVVLGMYMAMKELNPRYKDEIKVLTIGANDMLSIFPYPHYFVDQPAMKIGEKAVELLLKEIDGDLLPSDHIETIATRFVETQTSFLHTSF